MNRFFVATKKKLCYILYQKISLICSFILIHFNSVLLGNYIIDLASKQMNNWVGEL